MEKKTIYLVEFHGDELQIPMETDKGSIIHFKGLKVFRIVDDECNEVAKYDVLSDKMDISALCKENVILYFAGSTDGLRLNWLTAEVDSWNTEKTEIVIKNKRLCSFPEVSSLNEMFPSYLEHCALTDEEFVLKNYVKKITPVIEIPKENKDAIGKN